MDHLQRDDLKLGFDPALTRDNLLACLRANSTGVHARVPVEMAPPELSDDEREAALWECAKGAAMAHTSLHRVSCDASEKCDKAPCKVRGAALTLFELWHEWDDRYRADLSEGIYAIAAHMRELDYGILVQVDVAAAALLDKMNDARRPASAQASDMTEAGNHDGATRLRQTIEATDRLLEPVRTMLVNAQRLASAYVQVEKLSMDLCASDLVRASMHRPLPTERGPGRRKASLLAAVLQHLQHDGFTYREIRELVAGMESGATSTTPTAVKDQIRSRIGNDDRRRIRLR